MSYAPMWMLVAFDLDENSMPTTYCWGPYNTEAEAEAAARQIPDGDLEIDSGLIAVRVQSPIDLTTQYPPIS